jgi:hypothetical protein
MAVPFNQLQNVRRYVDAGMALLLNTDPFVSLSNKKFSNFNKLPGQLGATVDIQLPIRLTQTPSLVANFQGVEQRLETLSVNQESSVAMAFTAQQFIFNVDQFMDQFGEVAIATIGETVAPDIASLAETAPFRFFGDGIAPINSVTQLARAMALFRNFGSAQTGYKGILPDVDIPAIVGTALNEFVLDRNEKFANSWELGSFSMTDWYSSVFLPTHTAGNVGNNATTLTVVSINAAGDQLTVNTGGGADANAIFEHDSLEFDDGVAGQPNLRFKRWIGSTFSENPVQLRATADAAADGAGNITIPIYPALVSDPLSANRNINAPIAAGMELSVLPNHRCGLIYSGNALFAALPKLPEEDPFFTVSKTDPTSNLSLRFYSGSKFGLNERGSVFDIIWGKTLVPEYAMKVVFPIT